DSEDDLSAIRVPQSDPRSIDALAGLGGDRLSHGSWMLGRGEETKLVSRSGGGSAAKSRPAAEPQQPPPSRTEIRAGARPIRAVAWEGRVVAFWSRFQLPMTIGFAAIALGVLGFLILRSSIGGQSPAAATAALILGIVGTIAFVLLSLSAIVL